MTETTETIGKWGLETFGPFNSLRRAYDRAADEFEELGREVWAGSERNMALEIADVVIVLSQILYDMGYDLQQVLDEKMQINRSRKWILNGDGTGDHV